MIYVVNTYSVMMFLLCLMQELKATEAEEERELEALKRTQNHLTWKLERLMYVCVTCMCVSLLNFVLV